MPYVKQNVRPDLDKAVDAVIEALADATVVPGSSVDGNLNYIFSSVLNRVFTTEGGYRNIKDAVGLLECVKLEFYRRRAAPYEDQKAFENGDVYDQVL